MTETMRHQRADGPTERRAKALPRRAEALTDAALDLFSQKDFSAVTIKDIAKAAGVNTALIYYYFESKEGLFRATLENAVAQALEKYRLLRERHTDPVDLIGDWFDTQRELSAPIRQLVKIMLDYSSTRTQAAVIDEVIQQFYNEEMGILASSVRRGMQTGIFRSVDPDRAARFASTHLDGIFVRSLIHKDFDLAAALDELKSLFWQYLGHEAVDADVAAPARLA
jgi:AcrR family transcriptional regulator